jgi:hypothetical protein
MRKGFKYVSRGGSLSIRFAAPKNGFDVASDQFSIAIRPRP